MPAVLGTKDITARQLSSSVEQDHTETKAVVTSTLIPSVVTELELRIMATCSVNSLRALNPWAAPSVNFQTGHAISQARKPFSKNGDPACHAASV